MDPNLLPSLKSWFNDYVQKYKITYPEMLPNLEMKETHTYRVCSEIIRIGERLALSAEDLQFAEILALFHDVGRFEQYVQNKSFMDGHAFNHAEKGVEILKNNNLLRQLTPERQKIACRAILYHNRASLPMDETDEILFYAKMLRDADKLDIFEIVLAYYRKDRKIRIEAVEIDLPNEVKITDKVLEEVLAGNLVRYTDMKTQLDFKVLMFSWFYDINYLPALQLMYERNYLTYLYEIMPRLEKIDRIYNQVQRIMEERLNEASI